MLFNLSDENIPDKPLAKKIVDMILRQNQSGPVQVNGYKLLQLIRKILVKDLIKDIFSRSKLETEI